MDDQEQLPQFESGAQPAAPRRSRIYYGWIVAAAAMIISAASVGVRDSFGLFVIPIAEEFGWSSIQFSAVVAAGGLVGGFSQPFLGHLFDRFNSRKVILTSVGVAGLTIVGLNWTASYWYLLTLYGVVFSTAMGGASFAILGPLVARWFLRRRTLVLALLMSVPTVGSLFLAPTTALVIAYYGWRLAWLVLGAVLLFLALPVGLKFLRNWPSEMGLRADGEPESPVEASIRGDAPLGQYGRFEVVSWRRAFRSPPIWVLLPVFAIGGFALSIVDIYFFSFVTDSGFSLATAGILTSAMTLLGVIGAVAGGWLADRFPRKKVLGAALLAQGMALLVLISAQALPGFFLFAVLAGLSGTAWMVIALSLIADIYGLRALATLWGIAFLFNAIGRVFGPLLGGLAIDFTGGSYVLPFASCALMLVLASGMAFAVDERKYSARYQAATLGKVDGN